MSVEYFWTVGTMFSAGDNAHRSTILWHFVAPSLAVSILTPPFCPAPAPTPFPKSRRLPPPPLPLSFVPVVLTCAQTQR